MLNNETCRNRQPATQAVLVGGFLLLGPFESALSSCRMEPAVVTQRFQDRDSKDSAGASARAGGFILRSFFLGDFAKASLAGLPIEDAGAFCALFCERKHARVRAVGAFFFAIINAAWLAGLETRQRTTTGSHVASGPLASSFESSSVTTRRP